MDRANYELAWHLTHRVGGLVHLVSHSISPLLAAHPCVTWHRVPKPLNSYTLGAPLLARKGRRVAEKLVQAGARVVVNGGNCAWPDVNWVHAVHAAWDNRDTHAPRSFKLRNHWNKCQARRAEYRAVHMARVVLTNSESARQQLIDRLGIRGQRIHVVYLGTDAEIFHPWSERERSEARRRLGWSHNRPMVAFIGALGHDRNKGFDVLFGAWEKLCEDPQWDVDLVAAGHGAELGWWRRRVAARGLWQRVHLVGFSQHVAELLAAVDALVSPVHYDAYGLGVHEALCCGLPALVTRCAGVAERYPHDLTDLLLDSPPNVNDVAQRLYRWRRDRASYNASLMRFSRMLRQHTWEDMAAQIVRIIESVA
jgi:glycosyltransferase involved in cell wall biosynthesis